MIVINFITVMAFPNGLYTHITEKGSDYYCWFLGYKNPQIRFFLPAIGFNFVSDYFGGKKISFRTCVIILIILLTESRIDSSTSMVGLAVFAILYIVWRKKEKIRRYFELFKLSYFYIAACVASILVVFFNIQSKFSFLIENVLHRNVGLTDRTIIWARVILAIKNNLFGLRSTIWNGSRILHICDTCPRLYVANYLYIWINWFYSYFSLMDCCESLLYSWI